MLTGIASSTGVSSQSSKSSFDTSKFVSSLSTSTLSPLVNTSLLGSAAQQNDECRPIKTSAEVPNSDFGEFKSATTSGNKYGIFDVLKTSPELPTISDKTSGFGEFNSGNSQPVISGTLTTSTATSSTSTLSGFGTYPSSGNTFGKLDTLATSKEKTVNADFGSFVSVGMSTSFDDFNTSSSNTEGWANFTQAHPPPSTTLSPLDVLPTPRQPLPAVSSAPVTVRFESSAALLDVVKPETETKQIKSLTGLEILDAEMEARLLSKETSTRPLENKLLVPESLGDFGVFEAFGGVQVNSVPSQESATEPEVSVN